MCVAVLGLCCGAWALHCRERALSSCGEQGLPSSCSEQASHCGGISCCRAQALGREGFSRCRVHTDLVASRRVGSSQTRDPARVPCPGRQILNHWTTGKVPFTKFFKPEKHVLNHLKAPRVTFAELEQSVST